MTERLELYKCETCGNLVQVILPSTGEIICCGKPMKLLIPHKTDDEMKEKHVPVFAESAGDGKEVRVGKVLHPMTEEHYIQFIETVSKDDNHIELQYYSPFDVPVMNIKDKQEIKKAQAYCNIHGLWEGEHD